MIKYNLIKCDARQSAGFSENDRLESSDVSGLARHTVTAGPTSAWQQSLSQVAKPGLRDSGIEAQSDSAPSLLFF